MRGPRQRWPQGATLKSFGPKWAGTAAAPPSKVARRPRPRRADAKARRMNSGAPERGPRRPWPLGATQQGLRPEEGRVGGSATVWGRAPAAAPEGRRRLFGGPAPGAESVPLVSKRGREGADDRRRRLRQGHARLEPDGEGPRRGRGPGTRRAQGGPQPKAPNARRQRKVEGRPRAKTPEGNRGGPRRPDGEKGPRKAPNEGPNARRQQEARGRPGAQTPAGNTGPRRPRRRGGPGKERTRDVTFRARPGPGRELFFPE